MRPLMKLYADAGGKVITASIMHKPWNGQTYDALKHGHLVEKSGWNLVF